MEDFRLDLDNEIIDENYFEDFDEVSSVIITEAVKEIDPFAFRECMELSSIEVLKENEVFDSRCNCNAIIESATDTLIVGCMNTIIPESVKVIGERAFSDCTRLKSITIPDSVKKIEKHAFSGCTALTKVIIPAAVEEIVGNAFDGCNHLEIIVVNEHNKKYDSRNGCNAIIETESNTLVVGCKRSVIPDTVFVIGDYAFDSQREMESITLPTSVKVIGDYAFVSCSGLKEIVIPDSVTWIGMGAFIYCIGITSVVIPNSVTGIGKLAFMNCTSLTSLYIPDSITDIGIRHCNDIGNGYSAFFRCSSIKSIVVGENNPVYDSRNDCNAIIETETNSLILGCQSTIIPDGVTKIWDEAFAYCEGLTSIVIPDSVEEIGVGAFMGCINLESVVLPSHLKTIKGGGMIGDWEAGEGVFLGCSRLKSVVIPESVNMIESEAFKDCSSLQSVVIPDSVMEIGSRAFAGCSSLDSLSIPNSVKKIWGRAFDGDINLSELYIPASVNNMGNDFSDCGGLVSIKVDEHNKFYDSRCDCNAIIETETNTLIRGSKQTIIPNSVSKIAWGAFSNCKGLSYVLIPANVTEIGRNVFEKCSDLVSIVVDKDNKTYDSRCDCNAIIETKYDSLIVGCSETIIPNTVKRIEEDAFRYCAGLKSLSIPSSVEEIEYGWSALKGCSALASITVDRDNKVYDSRNNCNAVIITETNTLVLGCKGTVIPDTVSVIDKYALRDCLELRKIVIPASVEWIKEGAMCGCSDLTSIEVDAKNEYYDSRQNCNAIIETYTDTLILGCKETVIPDSVRKIAKYAFAGCENLESIVIPDSVLKIEKYAFCGCINLKSIVIPDHVYICNDAFDGCDNLLELQHRYLERYFRRYE